VSQSLPNGAAGAIERYLGAVDAATPGLVVGLHVVGSLALGDYRPYRSDIDVVAIVAAPPDSAQRSLLGEIHRVVATRVDGPYVTVADVRGAPGAVGPVAHHVGGRFELDVCHEVSPITWAILAQHAITVRGDDPAALGVRADEEAVRAFSADNLRGYWARWARTIATLIDGTVDRDTVEARMFEWGVLGAARVHCAATTGCVVSKLAAAEYAHDRLDPDWKDVVDLAVASRLGEIDDVTVRDLRRACAFVMSLASP
jgi:Nucleotidyltransferase domain/Domain of unknown function (DUF4111)